MRLRATFPLLFVLLFAAPASAHPLTDFRFDRTAAVRLSAEGVEVSYTLEVSALAMHLDAAKRLTPADIAALDRTATGYARAYASKVAGEISDRFVVSCNGQRMPLRVASIDVAMTDHAVCRYRLLSPWPPGGRERTLEIHDRTFMDLPGVLNLTLDQKGGAGPRVEILDSEEPPAKMRMRPLSQFTEEEQAQARRARAEIRLPRAIAAAAAAPPPSEQPTPGGEPATTAPEPAITAAVQPAPGLVSDLALRGLPALFDSTLGMGVLLFAAFLFGAAHAFTPGHGKTLVAAYLIGERGTVRHAILLATVTTLTHTGSVIAVAAVLWSVYGNDVPVRTQGTLQFVAGMLVMSVGLWLLLRRFAGKADHFHLFGGGRHHHGDHHHHHHHTDSEATVAAHTHAHDHAHDHAHSHAPSHSHNHAHGPHHHHEPAQEQAKSTAGWLRIVLMGLGGGIVPCWDAVLLLVAAAALNRVGFAVPLLLAFSAGLGLVLVGLGVGVVYAYRAGSKRFREARWFQVLPMVSAAFLVGVGFWLCKQAVAMAQ